MFILGSLSVVQGLRTAMLFLSWSNQDLGWISQEDLLCHLPAFLLHLLVEELLNLQIQDGVYLVQLRPLLILDKAF